MAVYSKGYETKRRLVLYTHQKLQEQNVSSLTVRDIARENGLSAPALYRHFESLEYLIVVSSVRFLNEYMIGYGALMDRDDDLLNAYIEGWKLFNRYAFERPDIYHRLFWGQYNNRFGDAIQEYFELFPFSGSEKYPAYFYTLFFNDNIQERDLLILHRISNRKLITEEDAKYYSRTNPLIVAGMLAEVLEESAEERKKAEQECNRLLEKNFERVYKAR